MCRVLCFSFAVVALLVSVAIIFLLPTVRKMAIRRRLSIHPDSDFYSRWATFPVPLDFRIYIFEITNPSEVLRGANPTVRERGPYFFHQYRHKRVLNFSPAADRVSYLDHRKYIFNRTRSIGPLTDRYTIVNLPVVAIAQVYSEFVEKLPVQLLTRPVLMSFMASLLEIHRQNLFVRKSVGELLFDGYRLDFLDSLRTLARPLEMFGIKFPIAQGFPNNRFAIYLNRNNTPHGPFEVYTGVGSRLSDWSSRKTAHIYKWKNKTKLDWYGGKCNMLHGTDGTRFAPFIGSSQELALLAPEACRVVKMQRVRSIREDDIPGYRYELGIEQFLKPQLNPDNWCYCKNRSRSINDEIDQCSMSGLIDLSKCWFGAPIYATKPHFYQIDPEFRNGSAPTDMRPNPLIHESFIHVEPLTGIVMRGARRMQLNVKVKKHTNFPNLRLINNQLLIPLLWLNEEGKLNDKLKTEIKSRLIRPVSIARGVSVASGILGTVLLLLSCLCCCCCRKRPKNSLDSEISSKKGKGCCACLCCCCFPRKKLSKVKAEKSKEDDQLKSLVSPSASTLSVTSSTSENTQLTHVSEQPMRRTELMPLTLDPTRFQTTSPMVANWQQMYDLNMLTNYLSQMYMERQLQEMNWPAMAQQTGIVQLHPMYLGAAVNGQQPFRMNPMSASNASMLALPSVENVEESPQPAGESSQANRVQRQESLQQQNRPRANQVTFEEPSPRFVFGQPPSAVGPKPKPENADLLPNGTNDNLEADVDVEETEERAFNVLDISEDSFDDEIEDGRYSATMFKINRPAAANPN